MFAVSDHKVRFLPGGFQKFLSAMKEIRPNNQNEDRVKHAFKLGDIFFSVDPQEKEVTHFEFDLVEEEDVQNYKIFDTLSPYVIAGGWVEFEHTDDNDLFRVSFRNNTFKTQTPVTVWTDDE